MKVFIFIFYSILILSIVYRLLVLLWKMKQPIVFPVNEEGWSSIRIYPQKVVQLPRPSHQKVGITFHILMIVFFLVIMVMEYNLDTVTWPILLLSIVPYLQLRRVFTVFAVVQGGILHSGRFIRWESIKGYECIELNKNHRLYGYGKEVNQGFELRFKLNPLYFSSYVLVTDKKVKQKLTELLDQHIENKG